MTAHVCVHLCLREYLYQFTNMCVDPAMCMHACKHECVFRCVDEHLVCVSSKLGTVRIDVGRIKQTQPLPVRPHGPDSMPVEVYLCALPIVLWLSASSYFAVSSSLLCESPSHLYSPALEQRSHMLGPQRQTAKFKSQLCLLLTDKMGTFSAPHFLEWE